MRARTNATSRRVEAPNGGGAASKGGQEEEVVDCNGKDKPKFKRPPAASFKLPPPPRMASLSVRNDSGSSDKPVVGSNGAATDSNAAVNGNGSLNTENGIASSFSASSQSASPQPIPSALIPPPQSSSAPYQRVKRNPQASDVSATSSSTDTSSSVVATSGSVKLPPSTSYSSDGYSNSYAAQHNHKPSNYPQISHPYKPSSWYANARDSRRKRQVFVKAIVVVMTAFLSAAAWWGYQQHYLGSLQNEPAKRHHKNYHHHDRHHSHFHPMMGIVESPMGFSKEADDSKKITRSYRQMEQEHKSHSQLIEEQKHESQRNGQRERTDDVMHGLFSTVPVTNLSNDRLLPYVGFGVSSRSVEHKQVPIIVSTLLQYASSETEGGGGIAMLDAVIDEDRKLENDGGSLQYSITAKVVEAYEEEEEKLESSMARLVVTLVGRAIAFFGKEKMMSRRSGGVLTSDESGSRGADAPYDYENRLEVHLLVGLSGPDLGAENTVAALRDIMAELDGIVPPLPRDVLHADLSDWKAQPSSPTAVDRNVDVRLHVLLRLNHCHVELVKVGPCSSDETNNEELLKNWIDSYNVLERLYEANIIYGIGLDGIHGQDIQYLLKRSYIKPHLYRGDVSQALDIYGRRMGNFKNEHIATILKRNNITFLASNVAGHILQRKAMAPNAYALLQNLGGVLFRAHHAQLNAQGGGELSIITTGHKGEGQYYTVPRVVLSYLVRHKVCVLPHAYKAEHLADDAPESVGGLANFLTDRRVAEIGAALRALLSENDLPEDHGLGSEGEDEVAVVFHNMKVEEVHLFRVEGSGEAVVSSVKSGASVVIIANTGDRFTAYGADGQKEGSYKVSTKNGAAEDFTIPSAAHFPS